MNKVVVFLLFLLAPILAVFLLSKSYAEDPALGNFEAYNENYERIELGRIDSSIDSISIDLRELAIQMTNIEITMDNFVKLFSVYTSVIDSSIEKSKDQKYLSDDIYETRITNALGQPVDFYLSNKVEIKIFELKELGYRGYIAKVKLFQPKNFKVALADGELGKLETTSDAAKRTGAVLAINGGGFGAGRVNGELVSTMIGGTVIDSELVNHFVRKENEDLFFVGINRSGDLIGGIPETQEDILNLKPYQGVSFIPILIQDGQKLDLPSAWANTNHPRTIIGQYANDDLILIVVDGRQGDWSKGISLERLQDKLLELGVKDAYNLDGGGSTAMYFNGELLNKPSEGSERPVANNIIIMP